MCWIGLSQRTSYVRRSRSCLPLSKWDTVGFETSASPYLPVRSIEEFEQKLGEVRVKVDYIRRHQGWF